MKTKQLFVIISIMSIGISSVYSQSRPDPKDVILKAFAKCDEINNGHYQMDRKIKLMSNIDTMAISHDTYFDKQTDDDLYGFLFFSTIQMTGLSPDVHFMYTGDELFYYVTQNGAIFSKSKHEHEIRNLVFKNHGFTSFLPVTNRYMLPMPVDNLDSDKVTFEYIGNQILGGDDCYHIRIVSDPAYDTTSIKELIAGIVIDFWIRKDDYLPLQYSITRDVNIDGEIVTEYLQSTLTCYEFNNLKDKDKFAPESVPSHINFTVGLPDPQTSQRMLESGDEAPDVELTSLSGDKIVKLSEMGKKVIMLNFFFISCPPCIAEIPLLKGLSDKYQGEDFVLTGIIDEYVKTVSIEHFVKKHGIDYPVYIGKAEIMEQYPVTSYPTAYIISEGKVIYTHEGLIQEQDLDTICRVIDELLGK